MTHPQNQICPPQGSTHEALHFHSPPPCPCPPFQAEPLVLERLTLELPLPRLSLIFRCVPNSTAPNPSRRSSLSTPSPRPCPRMCVGALRKSASCHFDGGCLGWPSRMLPSYKRPFVSPSGAERSARRTGSAQKLSWGAERRDSARLSKGPPKNKGHQDRSLESRAPGRAASLRPSEPWPGVTGAAPRARGRLPAAPSPCKPCRRRRRPARPRSPTLRWDPGPGGRVHIRGTFSSRR